jgi:hypothetical protein
MREESDLNPCAGILEQSIGARNRVEIGLSYRHATIWARNQVGIGLSWPASLCCLAIQFQTRFLESIPRPIAGLKFSDQTTYAGGIDSFESISGILKSLKIQSPD